MWCVRRGASAQKSADRAAFVYVQGSYGFADPASAQRTLRIALDKSGRVLRLPDGRPMVTLGGSGPPARKHFISGAALVVEGRACC